MADCGKVSVLHEPNRSVNVTSHEEKGTDRVNHAGIGWREQPHPVLLKCLDGFANGGHVPMEATKHGYLNGHDRLPVTDKGWS